MTIEGIENIKKMALKKYPHADIPSLEYELREKRKGYVEGFLEGVEWFRKELIGK